MKHFILFFASSLLVLSACNNSKKPNPNALTEPYLCEFEPIGWSIEVPAGYELINEEEVMERNEKGLEIVESSIDQELIYSQVFNILDFRYDELHVFGATAEPFLVEYPGEWEETNDFVLELLKTTYTNKGMDYSISEKSFEEIGGQEFQTYKFIFTDKTGKKSMEQSYYSALINGFDVSVHITTTDDEIKEEMLEIWKSSVFTETTSIEEEEERIYFCLVNGDDNFESQDFESAYYWYLQALIVRPENEEANSKAEICAEKISEIQELEPPSKFDKTLERANNEMAVYEYQEALEYFERALELEPENLIVQDQISKINQLLSDRAYSK